MADEAPITGLSAIAAVAAGDRGLPELVRSLARELGGGAMLLDGAGSVLVLAARSSTDEKALSSGGAGVERFSLSAGGADVGELRLRRPASAPGIAADVETLLMQLVASELARLQVPVQASEEAAAELLAKLTRAGRGDPDEAAAGAAALGIDLARGLTMLVVRARVQSSAPDGWRERVTGAAWRGARAANAASIAGSGRGDAPYAEVLILLPTAEDSDAVRATDAVIRELRALPGHTLAAGRSRIARDGGELVRAADEAELAVNVAEGTAPEEDGVRLLAFEDTGAYRLLLPAMSDDPDELRRFYDETIAPVAAYDGQYETNLVQTIDAFLEADGNVANTAQRLFTHRHTIRYRLERVRELSGLDVGSTDGRERLSLGLKAMRVLGIPGPAGPASERATGS